MNSENQPKVFGHYGRVSTADQKDNGTSLETQLEAAESIAKPNVPVRP